MMDDSIFHSPVPIPTPEPTSKCLQQPVLRTLAPLLRGLETEIRAWHSRKHAFPIPNSDLATLEGFANDLKRQADALDVEKPLLVIVLMGGTGVGKSTLLNALARSSIALASFTRPTTRDPVVYYHHSVRPERLDPSLRHCRLVQHDRDVLAQKIIVDTPDLDSNDLSNREKLIAILPVADIVLYVGSQEKYHDQIGWDVFKEQRKRRAFAFVLNKWDRCTHTSGSGLRPDEDLLRDLNDEGFVSPMLFRTVAQKWLDFWQLGKAEQQKIGDRPEGLPENEQFSELQQWLESGLSFLEIEAVKARGVNQLLEHLGSFLDGIKPADLSECARRTQVAWQSAIDEESRVQGDVLLSTLDPYQAEIENHFSLEGQYQFRGLMAMYLQLTSRVRLASFSLRDQFSILPKGDTKIEAPAKWNLSVFAHQCTRSAGEKVLDQRATAFVNRLLVEADQTQFPIAFLNEPCSQASKRDWHPVLNQAIVESLSHVEQIFTHPKGTRKIKQMIMVTLANVLPDVVFVSGFILFIYRFFVVEGYQPSLLDLFLPFIVTLIVLIFLQALISILLPLRWSTVRSEFHRQLVERLEKELMSIYGPIPDDIAEVISTERDMIEQLTLQTARMKKWLEERQNQAAVHALYGK